MSKEDGYSMPITSAPDARNLDVPFGDGSSFASVMSWSDISFTLNKNGKKILDGVSGYVEKGEILAILGSSGSGKTTLLNCLAGRSMKGGSSSGTLLFDGKALGTEQFRQISTYVEQEDALIGSLTVRETIDFSARLALGSSVSRKQRVALVEDVIRSFGLTEQANVKVGTPIQKGISGGQKRRVSVASQLVTFPSLVFLDEPTSGLDSAASHEIIGRLKKIAKANDMIIICSIHQPSSSTFALFDKTLLLSRGQTCFFGPTAKVADYFERIGSPCPRTTNIADHMLDTTNVDFYDDKERSDQRIAEIVSYWQNSPDAVAVLHEIELRSANGKEGISSEFSSHATTPSQSSRSKALPQTLALMHRLVIKARRDILAYGVRMAMYVGLAIMMGTVWLRLSASQQNLQNFSNALFFGGAFMSFMQVAAIPSFLEDLSSFTKERHNGLYGPLPFLLSQSIVPIIPLFLITVLFSVITYWLVNFNPTATGFFKYILWLFLDLYAAESLVMLISSIMPIFVAALAVTAFANGLWMSVGGFLVPPSILNVFWKYTFHQIDYQRYVYEGMMRNEFFTRAYSCGDGCQCQYASALQDQCQVAGSSFLDYQGIGSVNEGKWIAILIGIILVMRLMTYGVLWAKGRWRWF